MSQYDWDLPLRSWISSDEYLARRADEEESDRTGDRETSPEFSTPSPESNYVNGVVSAANPYGCDDTAINSQNPCSFHWADEGMTYGPETPAQRWSACHQLGFENFCD